jgi:hypothetical protein
MSIYLSFSDQWGSPGFPIGEVLLRCDDLGEIAGPSSQDSMNKKLNLHQRHAIESY